MYKTGVMQNGKRYAHYQTIFASLVGIRFSGHEKSQKTRERFHKFVDEIVPNPRGEQLESKWDK